MGLFGRMPVTDPRHDGGNPFAAIYGEGRPSWLRGSAVEAALVEGDETLEVVGESHHQDNLWRIAGGRHNRDDYVRQDVYAMLLAEVGNPYDANAVSVWIDGLMVGYLSRDDAQRYRPGLLALQEKHRQPIALAGVIAGGGMREDGRGMLGVFLEHDPQDFGVRRAVVINSGRMRTGPSRAESPGESGAMSVGLTAWLHDSDRD